MKRIILLFISLMLVLSACAGQAKPTEQSFIPIGGLRTPTPAPQTDLTPAEQAAISRLSSTLNLSLEEISVVSTEAVEWPDGCLGVQRPGMMCTQAIVPGYRIILQANDEQFEFRTNESGSQVVQVSGAPLGLMEEAIAAQLAFNLGLDVDEIFVLSSTDVEFTDACLNVAIQDVTCAQVITPGKIIVLEANGFEFEYHISEDGSRVQPATLALVWTREGGIAGFCNRMTVFLSGEIYASDCRSEQPEGTMHLFADVLSATEQQEFFEWIQELEQSSLDASDPEGVSDRMLVTLEFFGIGESSPTRAERQALFEFAQNLYLKLNQ
ncbi:MAG: hypothetical protein L0287_36770 [Anaerolineae bacterium]|nr:hypothetical protein [Anaerolineae bacterium]